MLGLLLKDFYNIRKQAVWYIVMIGIFYGVSIAINNIGFCASIGTLVTISVPLTAIAYEEKEEWQKFIIASGINIRTIVFEKYLLGILFALISTIGYLAVFLIGANQGYSWCEFLIPVSMSIISLSIVLPIIFNFGVEKGRTYMLIMIALIMVLFISIMSLLDKISNINLIIFAYCSIALAFALLVISYIISIKIYSTKNL